MSIDKIATALMTLQDALAEQDIEIDHICLKSEAQGIRLTQATLDLDLRATGHHVVDQWLMQGWAELCGTKVAWPVKRRKGILV